MTEKRIEIRNLNMRYLSVKGEWVEALRSINFDVYEGEFVTLLGPSGCGKTTLLNCIGGLLKAASGEVLIGGQVVTNARPDVVSFVFQEPTLLPWRTVIKNVEFGLEVNGKTDGAHRRDIAAKYLKLVGIDKFAHYFPHELSGGMRQRVALARALALETDVILMDEPFGALDEQSRIILGNELARIQEETKRTMLFVTHSIEEALYLSDRVVVLTSRPGTITQILQVPFKKPRDPSLRNTYEFTNLRSEVWKQLEIQIEKATTLPSTEARPA